MNAQTFRGGVKGLEPLVATSRTEGWDSLAKLAAEVDRGDFKGRGAALFGVYGETLLGCGLVRDPYLEGSPDVGRLRHLYVLPGYRRQGVAETLVTAVITEAWRHYRLLRLRTSNPAAARLYERLGFVAITEPAATHTLTLR